MPVPKKSASILLACAMEPSALTTTKGKDLTFLTRESNAPCRFVDVTPARGHRPAVGRLKPAATRPCAWSASVCPPGMTFESMMGHGTNSSIITPLSHAMRLCLVSLMEITPGSAPRVHRSSGETSDRGAAHDGSAGAGRGCDQAPRIKEAAGVTRRPREFSRQRRGSTPML